MRTGRFETEEEMAMILVTRVRRRVEWSAVARAAARAGMLPIVGAACLWALSAPVAAAGHVQRLLDTAGREFALVRPGPDDGRDTGYRIRGPGFDCEAQVVRGRDPNGPFFVYECTEGEREGDRTTHRHILHDPVRDLFSYTEVVLIRGEVLEQRYYPLRRPGERGESSGGGPLGPGA